MNFRNTNSIPDLYQAYQIILPISNMYPDFKSWYWDKVVPGIVTGSDKIIIAEHKGEIVGVSLIKKSHNENKLRALRISDKYQKKGYGLYLIDESLKELGDDKPIVSVSEEMINQYSRIFVNRYEFNLSHVYKGLYRKDKLEYEFNGNQNLEQKSVYF